MWLRIVRARRSGIDLGAELLAQADPAVKPAVVDDEPGHRALRVLDREDDLAGRIPEHPAIADLAAALRVEGRPVEHEEGLGAGRGSRLHVAARLQLLVLDPVADDGHDAARR